MKICPVCEARCFDDMPTCYGCMHRFAEGEGYDPLDGGRHGEPLDGDSHPREDTRAREADATPQPGVAHDSDDGGALAGMQPATPAGEARPDAGEVGVWPAEQSSPAGGFGQPAGYPAQQLKPQATPPVGGAQPLLSVELGAARRLIISIG